MGAVVSATAAEPALPPTPPEESWARGLWRLSGRCCRRYWSLSSCSRRIAWFRAAEGSRAKASRKLGLARLQKSSVDVVDSEMVLFEWLRCATHPAFKAVTAVRGRAVERRTKGEPPTLAPYAPP